MRIYFSGAHSSGKSTLTRYVSERYTLPMINEAARVILNEKELHLSTLRSDLNSVNQYQSDVFYRQLEEEAKHKSFVGDRCLIDCVAYAIQHSSISAKLIKDPKFAQYIEQLKTSQALIFFVRPSKSIMVEDGVRETPQWDGMVAIDAIIKTLYEMNSIRYFQIGVDSIQERIKLIDNVIGLAQ
jgi:predicted ATPase